VLLTTVADLDAGDLSDAAGLIRDRRLRGEERWERLGNVGLGTAAIFVLATVHGIWTGDDLAGLVMTIVPGVAMFGVWAYARLRVSQIVEGRSPSIVQRLVSWSLVAAAIAVVALAPRSRSRGNDDDRAGVWQPIYIGDTVDVGYIPGPDGAPMRSMVRKGEATREGCPDHWRRFPPPNEHTGYCDRSPKRVTAPPR
jgi:hypothetical protein